MKPETLVKYLMELNFFLFLGLYQPKPNQPYHGI